MWDLWKPVGILPRERLQFIDDGGFRRDAYDDGFALRGRYFRVDADGHMVRSTARHAEVQIDARELERARDDSDGRFVAFVIEHFRELAAKLLPRRVVKPPKGWRLFGRRR